MHGPALFITLGMFEHMKNYEKLLEKISGWLNEEGKLFVDIFSHKWKPYHYGGIASTFSAKIYAVPAMIILQKLWLTF